MTTHPKDGDQRVDFEKVRRDRRRRWALRQADINMRDELAAQNRQAQMTLDEGKDKP